MQDPKMIGEAIDTVTALKGALVIPEGVEICIDSNSNIYLYKAGKGFRSDIDSCSRNNEKIKDALEQINNA
jgi:hypothetical protein